MNKKCSNCDEIKTLDQFNKNSHSKDGLRPNCKECSNRQALRSYYLHRDSVRKRQADYHIKNRSDILKRKGRTEKARINKDPVYRFGKRVKGQIRQCITGFRLYGKRSTMNSIVGLTGLGLRNYLHSTFEYNYGLPRECINLKDVEIDHISPLSTAQSVEDVRRLNHYTNLQLLLKEDNQAKGTKLSLTL